MTPKQVASARAMLGLTQQEFADLCDLTRSTIVNIEVDGGKKTREATWEIIREVFEVNGVEFIDNETHIGVLLCK